MAQQRDRVEQRTSCIVGARGSVCGDMFRRYVCAHDMYTRAEYVHMFTDTLARNVVIQSTNMRICFRKRCCRRLHCRRHYHRHHHHSIHSTVESEAVIPQHNPCIEKHIIICTCIYNTQILPTLHNIATSAHVFDCVYFVIEQAARFNSHRPSSVAPTFT